MPDREYKKQKLGNKSKRQNIQNWVVIHLVRQTRKGYMRAISQTIQLDADIQGRQVDRK